MKRFLMAALCIWMALGGAAYAAENSGATAAADEWTAEAKGGAITVTGIDGKKIAELEYEREENTAELLSAGDYNFDGLTDLAALSSMGTANSRYAVWLRTAEGGFERAHQLNEVCAPTPNGARRRIESFERISASEYREGQYIWKEGQMCLLRMREIRWQTDGMVAVVEKTEDLAGTNERKYEIEAARWEEIIQSEAVTEEILAGMTDKYDCEMRVSYEGMTAIDGETYYACSVNKGYETVCVVYVHDGDASCILLDDEMDGEIDPGWQMADGVMTERSW